MSDEPPTISRRQFTALSLVLGATAAAGVAAASGGGAIETDVKIRTPDGVCDAALIHPQGKRRWRAAILFVDAFGLRAAMRDMARRLAAEGYAVLVPNPYYRSSKAPGVDATFDFTNAADRSKLESLRAKLTGNAVMQDAAAYVKFLDAHASVDEDAAVGVFGYCMGGAMALQAAAAVPGRIGAGASFHCRGLVTDGPDSPHLLVPRMKARYYIGIAANDDRRQPAAKSALGSAFHSANLPAKIEVYGGTLHGWCVKEMRLQDGKPIYDEAQAERAWNELLFLYEQVHGRMPAHI